MRRLTFLLSLSAILLAPISNAFATCCECSGSRIAASPTTGIAPLDVLVTGSTFWTGAVEIDMGGEKTYVRQFVWDGCYSCVDFSVGHTFRCPGTYQIKAYDTGYPEYATITSVTVAPPAVPTLFVFAGDTAYEAYLAIYWYVAQRPFSHATVDWGDETSEAFVFAQRDLYFGTPNHLYAADGEYTATLTLHYDNPYCSWKQSVTATVKVPGTTTATQASTWGGVKAKYR